MHHAHLKNGRQKVSSIAMATEVLRAKAGKKYVDI